jgi:hypothetical protein
VAVRFLFQTQCLRFSGGKTIYLLQIAEGTAPSAKCSINK